MKLSVKLSWGTSDASGVLSEVGSRDESFENVGRGKWNERTVDIPALKPTSFGYLGVSRANIESLSLVQF